MKIAGSLKLVLQSVSNVHRQGPRRNIFLFSTPRSGSTWVMEVLASQPGIKAYDEPFNIRRANVQQAGRFRTWESLMPGGADLEAIARYLEDIRDNRHKCLNPVPFRKGHRWLTSRVIYKIHELEHLIEPLRTRCNGLVVYLMRHPIPTTLSRAVHPRLELFMKSPFYREELLSPEQVRSIEPIVGGDDHFRKGLVSWCFENLAPLRGMDSGEWVFLTYEELLLNPAGLCSILAGRLELDDPGAMLRAVGEPSSNIAMSGADTLALMKDTDEARKRRRLVTKWRAAADEDRIRQTTDVLNLFGLDAYAAESYVAHPRYLHLRDTAERAASLEPPVHD